MSDKTVVTSVDLTVDHRYLQEQIAFSTLTNDLANRFIIKPYRSWIDFFQPFGEYDLNLNVGLFEKHFQTGKLVDSSAKTLPNFFGKDNIEYVLDETLKDVDLWKSGSLLFANSIKSPLDKKHFRDYSFFLVSENKIDSVPCYEIAFFPNNLEDKALQGLLYVSTDDYQLLKAIFTVNYFVDTKKIRDLFFIQTPQKKEVQAYLGDDIQGSLVLSRTTLSDSCKDTFQLNPSQRKLDDFLELANQTRAYRNTEKIASFLLTEHIPFGFFNFGPVLHTINYNKMEGLRLRLGGHTSMKMSPKFSLGGYVAYGFKDEKWKYRGDIIFSPKVTDKLSATYVEDLNIPGYNLLTSRRDNVLYSFSQTGTDNMSLQKIGQISYEKKWGNAFSFKLGGQYLYDQPMGKIRYIQNRNETETVIPNITTSEVQLSLRFAPGEKFIRMQNKKINFNSADFAIQLDHRIGLNDFLKSDYQYQITELSLYKRLTLPSKIGMIHLQASAGKVWDRVPFPLLFIPAGNHSYVFNPNDYNLMRFNEFVTDNYVAANMNIDFNWSPVKLLLPNNGIKTTFGAKTIYGPLSDSNNPDLHPELFVFNNGVQALGNQPYTELNIGLKNIFRFLQFNYVYRLNYGNKGGFFFTSSMLF